MTVGFNTGSKWYDNYMEAYYEVIECYYDKIDIGYGTSNYYDEYILPTARSTAKSLKGVYKGLDSYYEDYYRDYFDENSWATIWAGYGYGDCDVDKIVRRWGFSSKDKKTEGNSDKSSNSNDTSTLMAPAKFKNKHADKITNFNPSTDTLGIDTDSFGIGSHLLLGKNKDS